MKVAIADKSNYWQLMHGYIDAYKYKDSDTRGSISFSRIDVITFTPDGKVIVAGA